MIQHLSIKNYALIDHLEIDFSSGLTVITGETGSGKSIILGALGLALGERADHNSLGNSDLKCIIEITFRIDKSFSVIFENHDLDWEKETIIRREITPSGKSRSFINDTPVNLQILKELGHVLVDIHSQHQNDILKEKSFRFRFVDALAGCIKLQDEYNYHFEKHSAAIRHLELLDDQLKRMSLDQDYNAFQLSELKEIQLSELNQNDLEEELKLLSNSEEILRILALCQGELINENQGICAKVDKLTRAFNTISSNSSKLQVLSERLESVGIEFHDMLTEIENLSEEVNLDPNRQNEVNEILNQLYRLQQKHHVSSIVDLLKIEERLVQNNSNSDALEQDIEKLKNQLSKEKDQLEERAENLHLKRISKTKDIEKSLVNFFHKIALDKAELNINLSSSEELHAFGKDEISLMFSANPGSKAGALEDIASGGETARVMLAVKASLSKAQQLPTLILDEVDTGVSGDVALKLGGLMQEMSVNMQLIAISHLPQIAAKAQHHFKVYKLVKKSKTSTHIVKLSDAERIDEIAEMIGGKDLSSEAKASAKSLIFKN